MTRRSAQVLDWRWGLGVDVWNWGLELRFHWCPRLSFLGSLHSEPSKVRYGNNGFCKEQTEHASQMICSLWQSMPNPGVC